MKLLRQTAITFATRMTITLVNIPISMIIARTLGAEGQGIYSAAITFPNLWAGCGLLGLDAAHVYYLARNRTTLGPILANSILILLLLSAVLLPSYILLLRPLVGAQGEVLHPYLLLSAVVVPLMLARHLLMSLFLGLDRIGKYNGLLVVSQIALLAMVAGGLLVANGGTRFVIIAFQMSLVAFLIPALFWLRGQVTREDLRKIRPSRQLLRDSAIYGTKGHLGSIFTQFSYRFDMVLVLRWLGAAPQGYYSIAVLLAEKLTHITTSVQFVLFPRISAASRDDADRITPIVCRNTLMWMTVAGLILFVAGRFLIRLFYTDAYLPALGAYQVLLPGIVALTLSNVLSSDFSGRNRRWLPTIAMGMGFGLNLLLNILWIPRMGIVGAAWASTVSYSTQSVIMAFFFWRITGISPHRLVIPCIEDVGLYRNALLKLAEQLRKRAR
ncbi:MAG: polysaccharide biosynthesis C-terminal domain-containing protein [Candidatus Eisenbacteria sp.]|nr:polysaccharide biosynthesis C-terminal domain-containing protein [Candidatus Eisenbacteria bacterium]